jgi:hypothetical protein
VHEFTIGRNSGDAGLDERSTSGSTMAGDEAEFVIPVPPPRPQRARYLRAFAVTAAWTGALMALLPLALTLAQCAYLHEPLLSGSRSSPRGGGGIVALARTAGLGLLLGLVAGALAQGVFSLINVPHGGAPPRFSYLIGWTLLGALVGLFSALITPCLPRTAAVLAGAVAGLLAGLLFLPLAGSGDGLAGRIAGATLIGAAIGLMIALLRPDPPVSLDDWLGDDVYDFVPPLVVPQRRGAPVGTLQMPRRLERRGRASSHVRSSDNVNTAEERALRRWRRKNSVAPSSPQTDGRR